MRIRNLPAPTIFPPPPDLRLNRRSFPSPPPQLKQQLPAVPNIQLTAERQLYGADDCPACSDRTVSTCNFSVKRSSPAAAISTDDYDNDSSWKDASIDDDTGEQLQHFSHSKGTVSKGAAGDKRRSSVGAATMEGSRCSRVNGRGWRCSQLTLVGYSLCEHHLGKSRLRSLSCVKNVITSCKNDFSVAPSSNKKKRPVDQESDDDEPLLISSGRKKLISIGTVKARSLSSLLGQTSQATNVSSIRKKKCHKY